MASSKNKTTNSVKGKTAAGKTSGRKPGRPRKNPVPVQEEPTGFLRAEVMILLSFAAAVLLFLSNFHLCGVAGDFLRGVQLGLFGMAGYIAPLILFVGTCFAMSNRGNRAAARKLAAAVTAFFLLCGFAQLFSDRIRKRANPYWLITPCLPAAALEAVWQVVCFAQF